MTSETQAKDKSKDYQGEKPAGVRLVNHSALLTEQIFNEQLLGPRPQQHREDDTSVSSEILCNIRQ